MVELDTAKPAVELVRHQHESNIVLVCEHESNAIPAAYADLGLTSEVLDSHVAWDPGARDVTIALAQRFCAPAVLSTVSRLVYDCNRAPDSATAIVERSEIFDIPGNRQLSDADRQQRIDSVYRPFRDALASLLDEKTSNEDEALLITIHSFTPVYHGKTRAVEIGILHDADTRLADDMLAVAATTTSLQVCRNEPYGPDDDVTHTLCEHALPRQLKNVMIEVRNDLLEDAAGIATISELLAELLQQVLPETVMRLAAVEGTTAGGAACTL